MSRRLQRLAGVALVASVAAAAGGCGIVGGDGGYEVSAYFPRAVSVFESGQVRVLGLPAGQITAVVIEGDRVRVDMRIDEDIPVPADVRAEIIPQSLIGERYIQLSPAWRTGEPRADDGHVIDLDRTIIPVEPDEALAALKEFLDSLDPNKLGNLISNLEEDLRGNGGQLNRSLASFSDLVATFAEKDDVLVRIMESFDRLTASLETREQQIGEILQAFGDASQVLADERDSLEGLLEGLANVSRQGLDLVAEHAPALRTDIETLTRAAATIDTNLDAVSQLLDSGPLLVSGFIGAYNPTLNAMDLRNTFSPLISAVLNDTLGLDLPCIPVVAFDTVCSQAAAAATAAELEDGSTPIDAVLGLLGSDTEPVPIAPPRPGALERAGGAIADAAGALLGVGR